MANYPSYYPNQNPAYQPMYGNQFQNFQPPYQQNMMQTQMPGVSQQQFQQMPAGLNARIVDDFNTLSANDVPMDGQGAVFVKRDASEIQWRRWGNMGNIEMTPYKPVLEQGNQDGANTVQADLNTLYEDVKALRGEIAERFDRLEKSMAIPAKTGSPKTKKEADAE